MVMRPYQICATEKIINRITIAHNYHWEGSIKAGGYIWHTTGSGKTLTSFKTARLATQMDFIDKVVFVVDRKDLDYQTMKEYDRFEKGAANSNTSSNILRRQLGSSDPQKKLVITTIQKLASMLKNKTYEDEVKAITQKQIVFIFDECHRSQFGDMHTLMHERQPESENHGTGFRRQAAQLYHCGRHPRPQCTALPRGVYLHHEGEERH